MEAPAVVAVKRHSLEDGPGIRSVVFFKGCPLRCVFCQNPETHDPRPEIAFDDQRCAGCGACARACPRPAVEEEQVPEPCRRCGRCVTACPRGALVLVGRRYAVDELVELLLRDEPYYRRSGGGVTFSGGECTMFPEYVEAVAVALEERNVHLAIETCGDFPPSPAVDRVLALVELIYFDLKLADPEAHRRYTGRDNRRILENLARLARRNPERLRVRIPCVPEITVSDENFTALVEYLRARGLPGAILLPYNPLGLVMAKRLRRDHPLAVKCPGRATPRDSGPAPWSPSATHVMTAAEFKATCARFEEIVRGAR